uniref:Secreted protein n=1 Tax=Panagrolaimus sp. PS1159 TaxID=55785 RepID=A0AC35FEK3_9BILA
MTSLMFIFCYCLFASKMLFSSAQIEQRIASNINHGVDATADKITEWRSDAHNLGQAAQDKLYGAAGAVRK